jgi:hypothetical protein
MFDMAMEMHDLHRRGSEVAALLAPVNRQLPEVTKAIASRTDLPADVKTAFEALSKELSATVARFAALGGGGRGGFGGGRGGGAPDNPLTRVGQAKNGLMAGMQPTEQTTKAYTEAKAQAPKIFAEAAALLDRAREVSASLAKHNITLTVPPPPARANTTAAQER